MTLSSIGIKNHHFSNTLSLENNSTNGWVTNSSSFTHKMPPMPLTLLNADLLLLVKTFTADKIHINHTSITKLTILQLLLSCQIMEKFFISLPYCTNNSLMKFSFMMSELKPCSQIQSCSVKDGKGKSNPLSS